MIAAFGPLAASLARRLPPLDLDVLVVDERGALAAALEAARRYARGERFAAMLLIDDETALTLRALSPLILERAATDEQRRSLFESAAAGTLTIEGRPQKEILRRDPAIRRAMRCVLRLADRVLVRSRQELLRVSHACQQEAPPAQVLRLPEPRVPAVTRAGTDGGIVVWAPDWRTDQLGMWWTALELFHLPLTVVCADGEARRLPLRAIRPAEAAPALALARLIIDTSTADPSAAQALAPVGAPLLAAASSGADESVEGVLTYVPSMYGGIVMAVRRGLAADAPRLLPEVPAGGALGRPPIPAAPKTAPLVSVVMPTRDRPDLLRRALTSVRRQDWPAVEVVVVNDGGADVSHVVADFPQARLLQHPSPRGASIARNAAMDAARGDFVCFLDDDDVYLPGHLHAAVAALEAHGGDAVNAAYLAAFVDEALQVQSVYVYDGVYDGLAMQVWQPLLVQSVVARARALDGLRFDPSLPVAEDYEFLLRLGQRAELGYLPRPSWMITVHTASSLSTSDRYAESLQRVYDLHPVADAPAIQAARRKQVEGNLERGGRKAPWLPPLGILQTRLTLQALDGLLAP